jgi:hypothetical protein
VLVDHAGTHVGDRDHRLDRSADLSQVNVQHGAADDAAVSQTAGPIQHGGRRDADGGGDVALGAPCICPQFREDRRIKFVQLTQGWTRNSVGEEDARMLGYTASEITTDEPTRSAKYKWAIVVDTGVPAGTMVNAVACVAATTGALVDGLIGYGGPDATGHVHSGQR